MSAVVSLPPVCSDADSVYVPVLLVSDGFV